MPDDQKSNKKISKSAEQMVFWKTDMFSPSTFHPPSGEVSYQYCFICRRVITLHVLCVSITREADLLSLFFTTDKGFHFIMKVEKRTSGELGKKLEWKLWQTFNIGMPRYAVWYLGTLGWLLTEMVPQNAEILIEMAFKSRLRFQCSELSCT